MFLEKGVQRGYEFSARKKIGLSGNTGNAGHGLKMGRNTIEEDYEMMVMVKNKTLFQCWKHDNRSATNSPYRITVSIGS